MAEPENTENTSEEKVVYVPTAEEYDGNPMRIPKIAKVVVNFAVGQSGTPLEQAKMVCELITEQKPVERRAKQTVREFGIRKDEPIACTTTLRGLRAENFLEKVLVAKNNSLRSRNFDQYGNFSFGIGEHIDVPGTRYDPDIGVIGFEVSVTMERPGYRIKKRRCRPKKIPNNHRLTIEASTKYIANKYNIQIE